MSAHRRRMVAAIRAAKRATTPSLLEPVPIHEITEGMVLRVDPMRRTEGRVIEVREPSSGIAAAYGAIVVVMEYERLLPAERDRFGPHFRITHTLFPSNEPQAWTVPWPDTTAVTSPVTATTEENQS